MRVEKLALSLGVSLSARSIWASLSLCARSLATLAARALKTRRRLSSAFLGTLGTLLALQRQSRTHVRLRAALDTLANDALNTRKTLPTHVPDTTPGAPPEFTTCTSPCTPETRHTCRRRACIPKVWCRDLAARARRPNPFAELPHDPSCNLSTRTLGGVGEIHARP